MVGFRGLWGSVLRGHGQAKQTLGKTRVAVESNPVAGQFGRITVLMTSALREADHAPMRACRALKTRL
jgi:hypothetical protein